MDLNPITYKNNIVYMLDQRKIPLETTFFQARNHEEVIFAIEDMIIRGAPAIGVAGAFAFLLAAKNGQSLSHASFFEHMEKAGLDINKARPTAVNLSWAVERMARVMNQSKGESVSTIIEALEKEALLIQKEDIEINKSLGKHGATLVPDKAKIMTHCNAGALATAGYGTALGVIRRAHETGKAIHVYVNETRPRLQGARLTAFELQKDSIPCTLIVDSVAAVLMKKGLVDMIVVGADRIAANGDVANKIGTFMLSQLAHIFQIPFYVAAPVSTIDFSSESGEDIVIEERSSKEVTHIEDLKVAPTGIDVYNPAFDCTEAKYITALITEKGIIHKPNYNSLSSLQHE